MAKRPMKDTVRFEFKGKTPLLMHAPTTIDPTSADAQWISELSKKRGKDTDDITELSRREWMVNAYRMAGRLYYPIDNIHSCLYAAAKRFKEGPVFVGSFIVQDCEFVCDMPADFNEAWKISNDPDDERSWVDRRPVKVGTSRLMRTRPIFKEWSMKVSFMTTVDVGQWERWLETAGTSIGLGDYRPQKGGLFGQFTFTDT